MAAITSLAKQKELISLSQLVSEHLDVPASTPIKSPRGDTMNAVWLHNDEARLISLWNKYAMQLNFMVIDYRTDKRAPTPDMLRALYFNQASDSLTARIALLKTLLECKA